MPVEIITLQDLLAAEQRILAAIKKLIDELPPPPGETNWVRAAEVRKQLNISSRTLQRLRTRGTLKWAKVGQIVYYDYRYVHLLIKASQRK
jgi:hypothetical protein